MIKVGRLKFSRALAAAKRLEILAEPQKRYVRDKGERRGWTLLDFAVEDGDSATAAFLREQGVKEGKTKPDFAAAFPDSIAELTEETVLTHIEYTCTNAPSTHRAMVEELIEKHNVDITTIAQNFLRHHWGPWGRNHHQKHTAESAERARWLFSLVSDPDPELLEIDALARIEIGDWSSHAVEQVIAEGTAIALCTKLVNNHKNCVGTLPMEILSQTEALDRLSHLKEHFDENLRVSNVIFEALPRILRQETTTFGIRLVRSMQKMTDVFIDRVRGEFLRLNHLTHRLLVVYLAMFAREDKVDWLVNVVEDQLNSIYFERQSFGVVSNFDGNRYGRVHNKFMSLADSWSRLKTAAVFGDAEAALRESRDATPAMKKEAISIAHMFVDFGPVVRAINEPVGLIKQATSASKNKGGGGGGGGGGGSSGQSGLEWDSVK